MITAKEIVEKLKDCEGLDSVTTAENNGDDGLLPDANEDDSLDKGPADEVEINIPNGDTEMGEAEKALYSVVLADGGDIQVRATSEQEAIKMAKDGKGKQVGSYSPGQKVRAIKLSEGFHFNTKIKQLEAKHHPVKIKLALKEAHRMVENILDPGHPSPNPVDMDSRKVLESCSRRLGGLMEDMKKVVVKRRVPNEEG